MQKEYKEAEKETDKEFKQQWHFKYSQPLLLAYFYGNNIENPLNI